MDHITICPKDTHKLLVSLNIYTLTGPYKISTRLMKTLADELTPIIGLFFKAPLNQVSHQTIGRQQMLYLLFKKEGDREINLKIIDFFLTSVTSKLLQQVICSSIGNHLDEHSVLTNAQHGFRKRCAILAIQDLTKSVR